MSHERVRDDLVKTQTNGKRPALSLVRSLHLALHISHNPLLVVPYTRVDVGHIFRTTPGRTERYHAHNHARLSGGRGGHQRTTSVSRACATTPLPSGAELVRTNRRPVSLEGLDTLLAIDQWDVELTQGFAWSADCGRETGYSVRVLYQIF